MTDGKGAYESAATPLPSSPQGLLADINGQADARLVGSLLQRSPLSGGHADADGLAGVLDGGPSRAALLGLGHAARIRDTGTLDQGDYSCNGNRMIKLATRRYKGCAIQEICRRPEANPTGPLLRWEATCDRCDWQFAGFTQAHVKDYITAHAAKHWWSDRCEEGR